MAKGSGRGNGRLEDSVDRAVADITARYPAVDPEVEGVVDRSAAIARHVNRAFEDTLARHGLNNGEYKLLLRLRTRAGGAPMSAGELSRALLVSSGSMTNRLDRLERAGLVRRIPDPNDRRGVLIELTSEGERQIDVAVEEQAAKESEVWAALPAGQLATLNRLLRTVLLSLEQPSGQSPGQSSTTGTMPQK